jgi:2-phosphosulfolactate phosphatase
MKIEVFPFASAVDGSKLKDSAVVVIDVLRATSVMITALTNGAGKIIPVTSVESARESFSENNSMLLCGERDAVRIDGFHLGNSPLEFTEEAVKGKTLIITTTNGTNALNASSTAKEIFIGAFLNIDALVEKVKHLDHLFLVCSGTRNAFSLDDGLCAAMIIQKLSGPRQIITDDLGYTLLSFLENSRGTLHDKLKHCTHLNYLLKKGYSADVDFCLQLNSHPVVPECIGGEVILTNN